MPSSETEIHSRGRSALDRDGTSLEGASSPRARQNPARRGTQPSSEAEPHPRGRPTLERGEVLPVRHRHPRAKQSSARGCPGRLSGGPWAREFILRAFLGSLAFVFHEGRRVFPSCLGDPYGYPRQYETCSFRRVQTFSFEVILGPFFAESRLKATRKHNSTSEGLRQSGKHQADCPWCTGGPSVMRARIVLG
jgi:hypothetical protein